MSIQFPDSPSQGQTFEASNGVFYTYIDGGWIANNADALEDSFVNLTGDTMTGDLTVPSLNGGQLAGFRNVLINGSLAFNQRGIDIASAAAGSYGQDRWKAVAGGMTQIVEDGDYVPNVDYTLSGTGVTTTTATSPASGHWDISSTHGVVPVTARSIQMERGTVATPFELRPAATEYNLCMRYFQKFSLKAVGFCYAATGGKVGATLYNRMRTSPTVSNPTTGSVDHCPGGGAVVRQNISTISSVSAGTGAFDCNINVPGGTMTPGYAALVRVIVDCDAEL